MSWPGRQRQTQRIVVQQSHQAGVAGAWGAEVGPCIFHMLSEMDCNLFRVLTSNERVRTDIEFPSVGLHEFPHEM